MAGVRSKSARSSNGPPKWVGNLAARRRLAPSIANLWLFHYANGRLDAAEKVSHDLLRIAQDLDSQEVLLQAHHTAWPVRWGRGAMRDALGHIDSGLALYDEQRHAHHRFLYLGHDPPSAGWRSLHNSVRPLAMRHKQKIEAIMLWRGPKTQP